MKILFYMDRFPAFGGIERVTSVLANAFVTKYQYDISICAVRRQEEAHNLLNDLNNKIKYYRLPDDKNIVSVVNFEFFQHIIINNKIDIVIFQDSYVGVEALLKNVPAGVKIVVVEHNSPDCFITSYRNFIFHEDSFSIKSIVKKILWPYYYVKIKRRICRRHKSLYKLCDRYVLLSESFRTIFQKLLHKKSLPKLISINNPVTLESLHSSYKKDKICLFVGRLVRDKGIRILMNIWCKIEKLHPDWKLIIIGDGKERDLINACINTGKAHNIAMEGFKRYVEEYYFKASILCMTSIFEGWPLVLTEAMNFGVIPIAFNSFASAKEIIDDAKNGFLVPSYCVKKYVSIMHQLMSDENYRADISKNTYDKSQNFSVDSISERWKALFTAVMIQE